MANSPPIYTALNVPTVTSYPSVNCLQWSADGQVCLATKTAAYIMTPDHGIHFDISSTIRSAGEKDIRDGLPPIGWFRTIIPFEKTDVHKWPDYSQVWGAASLGSLDVSLWAISFSPSNLSSDAGCILAALSSNMDLTLWTAAKNCLKGEWVKIYEITPFLIDLFQSDPSLVKMAQAINAQIVSITWSPQADFGITPAPVVDGSLLIVGNRAGSLIFLRYRSDQTIEHLQTLPVYDKWITHLSFSPWTSVEPGTCEGYLAYATSDGAVGIIKVTQKVIKSPVSPQITPQIELRLNHHSNHQLLYEADKRAVTALSWIACGNNQILVHCKPGIIYLWSLSSRWSGYRSFLLKNQKISIGSSSFHTASGIQYTQRTDKLILTLVDGSFYVIHDLSTEPSLVPSTMDDPITSEKLSMTIRSAFVQSEQGEVEYSDVNRITGVTSYDSSASFIWLHEVSRPADFSYKHDAKHNSMLVVAKAWDDTDNETLMLELTRTLDNVKTATGFAPLHMLRPFFFHLRDREKLRILLPRILEILKPRFDDHSAYVTVPACTSLTTEMRGIFRKSLTQHLFGWDVLLSLRMRLSLADFAWKLSNNVGMQEECGHVAQILLNTISHRVLRTLIRHLVASVNILTPSDIPFVLRMVVQSLLPGSPEDLSAEGNHLSTIVQTVVSTGPQVVSVANIFNERCPACNVEVPLHDITSAVCSNGHTWARCTVTTFILSTPLVRTCIGCSRKAFLPPSSSGSSSNQNWLPAAARGWVVEELLEAVHRCLFCNNSFVSVL
ncbi:putative zinc-finger of transcription factor IIIC complex-domain-containing protein [Collybia nuda]|uniref:Zinc-finger of transcription factor IIIC complex-domain-containing protein n=1 Tax=Collybia nuda TaxID=64659 RepID=A0A9P5YC58_9AGAR|nr:putative zinc-finger of transcription factor IIIC complex-domain-containing protein [Collybia nuda]